MIIQLKAHHPPERRAHMRKPGNGLVVIIGGKVYPLINISLTGLSFQATGYVAEEKIELKIAEFSNMKESVLCRFTVVVANETTIRGQFYPTMPIMRYMMHYVSDVAGVEPAYF